MTQMNADQKSTEAKMRIMMMAVMAMLLGGCRSGEHKQIRERLLSAAREATADAKACGTVLCDCEGDGWPIRASVYRMERQCVAENGCFEGLTVLPRVMFIAGESCEEVAGHKAALGHECRHVCQVAELGVKRYVGEYLQESILRGYRENKFEREAFERPAKYQYRAN
jgi:hypothetical protein